MAPVPPCFKLFNGCVEEFIRELSGIYPSDKMLGLVNNAMGIICKTKPRSLQEAFALHVEPYREHIDTKDERFFMSTDASEFMRVGMEVSSKCEKAAQIANSAATDIAEMCSTSAAVKDPSHVSHILDTIKLHWKQMDADNREVVWEYMATLLHYSDECTHATRASAPPIKTR
jgi:hypothetical protein